MKFNKKKKKDANPNRTQSSGISFAFKVQKKRGHLISTLIFFVYIYLIKKPPVIIFPSLFNYIYK